MKHVLLYENYENFYPGDYVEIIEKGKQTAAAKIIYTPISLVERIEKIKGKLTYDEFLKKENFDKETEKLLGLLDSMPDLLKYIFVKKTNNDEFWINKHYIIRKLTIEEFKNYELTKAITKYNVFNNFIKNMIE